MNGNGSAPWDIPSNWNWAKLESIAEIVRGGSPRPKGDPRYFGGTIPWIMISDITREKGKFITQTRDTVTEAGSQKSRFLKSGTLILSNSGTVCVPKILKVDGCIHDGFVAFPNLTSEVEQLFLFYLFERIRQRVIQQNRQGVTQVNLNTTIVKNFDVPLPPLNEQKRIVAKIEELFTKLDAGVEALQTAKALLKRYRQSVLHAAVTGKLTEAWREEHKGEIEPASVLLERIKKERRRKWDETELAKLKAKGKAPKDEKWKEKYEEAEESGYISLPDIPKEWTWTNVGSLFEVCVGATPSRQKAEYWNGEVYWVSSGEVAFCRIKDTSEKITEKGLANSSTKIHPPGTVLLGMIGEGKTRGQTAILDVPACNNQNSAAIRVSDTLIPPEFVYHFLVGEYDRTRRRGSGNNQPALNKRRVESMEIPLPPINEQTEIVKVLEEVLSYVEAEETTISKTLQLVNCLRQSILKQAFEGKLVPQDPKDEPAEKLLERIRG